MLRPLLDNLPGLDAEKSWRPLRYLNLYRFTLAALFLTSFYLKTTLPMLGSNDPALFEVVAIAYLLGAVAASFAIHWRWPAFNILTYSLVVMDIIALTLLMRASGGVTSGLGMLLVVAIAGNSLLLGGRTSILFAAIASIAVLAEQIYAELSGTLAPYYTQAGILGATLFATAFLAHVLSRRIRESEALAAQRGVDLANLAQLNQHVIQRMQSGIIVVDANNQIRLMNESAWYMLGLPALGGTTSKSLRLVSPELAEQLTAWRENILSEAKIFRASGSNTDLLPSMTALGSDERAGTLIFLEDTARMAQQAQQMKLASLGRLTASIAHEIRNPLGAISHAEQLLAEAVTDNPADRRLLEIIHNNTSRVNDIIENILQLSRRNRAVPEDMQLKPWLEQFITEFTLSQGCAAGDVGVSIEPAETVVRMDATQLHQVLWNLCQNGLRYSMDYPKQPKLELHGGLSSSGHPFLDIIDHGPGIPPESAQHIFEPFFTTSAKGSGLGLYIARELCECNGARLSYLAVPTGGSCFRIEFADRNKQPGKP